MATKQSLNFTDPQHAEPHPYRDQSTDITLEIEGLIANSDGTFTLRGVRPVDLDYRLFETMSEHMVSQGIPKALASRLAEDAHSVVQTGLLADALAQRTRRVG